MIDTDRRTISPERLAEIREWFEWAKSTPAPRFGERQRPEHTFLKADSPHMTSASVNEMRRTVLGIVGDLLDEVESHSGLNAI